MVKLASELEESMVKIVPLPVGTSVGAVTAPVFDCARAIAAEDVERASKDGDQRHYREAQAEPALPGVRAVVS